MDLTELFERGSVGDVAFQEATLLALINTTGDLWVVGGYVYKTIAGQMYCLQDQKCDFDFVAEAVKQSVSLNDGWKASANKYGGHKFRRGEQSVDIMVLKDIHSIIQNGLPPTIEQYLARVPLNIQSIAYDIGGHRLIGHEGMQALLRRTIKVNDPHNAQYSAQKKGITVEEMVRLKADSLGFKYEL